MPIQLQNHRTSNAKLFSVSQTKQKLHTAASLQQTQKNNLKVRKNSSGSSFQLMHRMFGNPTNATANLPDDIPERSTRRRHSMTGSLGGDAALSQHRMVKRTTSSVEESVRRTASLEAPSTPTTNVTVNVGSGSGGKNKKCSLDISRSSTGSSMNGSHNNVRRSRSFGTPAILGPILAFEKPAARRRGSVPAMESWESPSDALSSHESMRSLRDQLRSKSMNGSIPVPQTPPNMLWDQDDDISDCEFDDSFSGSS